MFRMLLRYGMQNILTSVSDQCGTGPEGATPEAEKMLFGGGYQLGKNRGPDPLGTNELILKLRV